MVDPLGQVVRECGYPKITQKSVALTYAFAIRQEPFEHPNWRTANQAIIDKFGIKGLSRIKTLAWAYVSGNKNP